ncbi:hypothetical protein [Cetobacterium somerae]
MKLLMLGIIISVLIGVSVGINLSGLFEDVMYLSMGQDKYFEWYRNNFIHPKTTIPIHIMMLIILSYGIYQLIMFLK